MDRTVIISSIADNKDTKVREVGTLAVGHQATLQRKRLHASNASRKLSMIFSRIFCNWRKARIVGQRPWKHVFQFSYSIWQFCISFFGSLLMQEYVYVLMVNKRPGTSLYLTIKLYANLACILDNMLQELIKSMITSKAHKSWATKWPASKDDLNSSNKT